MGAGGPGRRLRPGRGRDLPPLNITAAEAAAIAVALAALPELPFAVDGRRALSKVLAAMPATEREQAEVDRRRPVAAAPEQPPRPAVARVLDEAVRRQRVLVLRYRDARRDVDRAGRGAGRTGGDRRALAPAGLVPAAPRPALVPHRPDHRRAPDHEAAPARRRDAVRHSPARRPPGPSALISTGKSDAISSIVVIRPRSDDKSGNGARIADDPSRSVLQGGIAVGRILSVVAILVTSSVTFPASPRPRNRRRHGRSPRPSARPVSSGGDQLCSTGSGTVRLVETPGAAPFQRLELTLVRELRKAGKVVFRSDEQRQELDLTKANSFTRTAAALVAGDRTCTFDESTVLTGNTVRRQVSNLVCAPTPTGSPTAAAVPSAARASAPAAAAAALTDYSDYSAVNTRAERPGHADPLRHGRQGQPEDQRLHGDDHDEPADGRQQRRRRCGHLRQAGQLLHVDAHGRQGRDGAGQRGGQPQEHRHQRLERGRRRLQRRRRHARQPQLRHQVQRHRPQDHQQPGARAAASSTPSAASRAPAAAATS